MRKGMTAAVIAGVSVVAVAVFMISALNFNTLSNQKVDAEVFVPQDVSFTRSVGADDYLNEGNQGAIEISTTIQDINATRGSKVEVPLTLQYRAGTQPPSQVTVVYDRIAGTLLPPSVVQTFTLEERLEMSRDGKAIPGAIQLTPLVTVTPGAITLKPGETKTMTMQITIPQNFPDEMVGKTVDFSPAFKLTNIGEDATIGIFGTIATVHVTN